MAEIEVYVQVLRYLAYGITIVSFVFMFVCKYKNNLCSNFKNRFKMLLKFIFQLCIAYMILFFA